MINLSSDAKMMYGRTLDGRSFTKGADPYEEHEEHEGETRGNTRETLNQQEIDHTCARSMNTKEDTLIQSQQRTIQTVTGFFSMRRS